MDVLLWIVAGVILAVGELFTVSFFLVTFALGAFAAAIAAGLGAPFPLQGVVFLLVTVASLLGVRPALKRLMNQPSDELPAITAQEAVVLERVDADAGMVKIDGERWQARAIDAQVLEPGERVHVVEIKGATAMVWRV